MTPDVYVKESHQASEGTETIHISGAYLCINCEQVIKPKGEVCPKCYSKQIYPVTKFMKEETNGTRS